MLQYPSIKVGDTSGLLRYRVLEGGAPPAEDLTLSTVVFRMKNRDTDDVVIAGAAGSVLDGLDGLFGYQRAAGDVLTAGVMVCQWTITFPSGAVHVSPEILLRIDPTI